MNPRTELGIVTGYRAPPGEPWKGGYCVLRVEELADKEFHRLSNFPMISSIEQGSSRCWRRASFFQMKGKRNLADRAVHGAEKVVEQQELATQPEPESQMLAPPAPVDAEVKIPMNGAAMAVAKAGDLQCIAINDPACGRYHAGAWRVTGSSRASSETTLCALSCEVGRACR